MTVNAVNDPKIQLELGEGRGEHLNMNIDGLRAL